MAKEKIKPKLFSVIKTYSPKQAVSDIVAGIIVAIIALPLSIALALASGVGPEQGLYTAIVAGFLISFFGGSRVQIAGPTAAFATIVAGIVATKGMDGLAMATVLAGIIMILLGVFRLGSLIKFIPYTITTGFTSGIAVTILIGQLKDFFGVTYANGVKPVETMEKMAALFENFSTVNVWAIVVGLVCLAILIIWNFLPSAIQKIPGSLVAVFAGIGLVAFLKSRGIQVNTIGDLYTITPGLPKLTVPHFSFQTMVSVAPDAFTIALLASIESLLSCVVADSMINSKHKSNTELIAQGLGNIGSAMFGGIPATGAIARTAANIKNGGRTPVAGMVHAVVLLLVLVLLMPYAALIPMPCIAAILFMVAYNMCQWRQFVDLVKKAPKSDILVLVITFVLTIVFDLVVAIEVGMVLACLLFIKRQSEETTVHSWVAYPDEESDPDATVHKVIPPYVTVYEIDGPLFFGAADQVLNIALKDNIKVIVLRMRSVNALDITALNSLDKLADNCEKAGIHLVLSHVNHQPLAVMKKAGFYSRIGKENFQPHIDDALKRADQLND